MLQQYLEGGKIVGTHGVRGELRVEPWCDSPAFLKQFKTFYWKQDGAVGGELFDGFDLLTKAQAKKILEELFLKF